MVGNGTFNFIPCPGFIGTIFVNSISNVIATMGRNCKLNVEVLNGVKIEKVYG